MYSNLNYLQGQRVSRKKDDGLVSDILWNLFQLISNSVSKYFCQKRVNWPSVDDFPLHVADISFPTLYKISTSFFFFNILLLSKIVKNIIET
jgi:hypothetical protein